MRKFVICAVAVLGIAAPVFAGLYYLAVYSQKTETTNQQLLREEDRNAATDRDIPRQRRGGAWLEEDGTTIKANGIADALSQRRNYLNAHTATDGFGDNGEAIGIPGLPTNWLPRGPQNLGGRTEAIVLHPRFGSIGTPFNRGIMWAGGSTGGVFKSFNSGTSWLSTNSELQNYNVSCIALDPADQAGLIMYAGTGQSDGASLPGGGVFKSNDGGMTWVRDDHSSNALWKAVNGIAVSHQVISGVDRTIVLAAVENYFPDATGAEKGVMRGISDDSGGINWTPVKTGESSSFVGFDPNNSSRAVAATCHAADTQHPHGYCKTWYSANYGQSWSASQLDRCNGGGFEPFESNRWNYLADNRVYNDTIHFVYQQAAPSSTPVLYAQYGDQVGNSGRTVLSKSGNGGAQFSTCDLSGISDGISQGVHAFWVSPPLSSPGGNFVSIVTGGTDLYRSNNNGLSFETPPPTPTPTGSPVPPPPFLAIANGATLADPVNPHQDMQTVITDPRYPNNEKRAFVATDGGLYHTNDITTATGVWAPGGTPVVTPTG